jgi:uncharacterized protein (TIGR02271 family)
MTGDDMHTDGSALRARETAEVVRSEERLDVTTRLEVVGRVRIAKRVVTEERVVTVSVRREELIVEELPVDPDRANDSLVAEGFGDRSDGTAPPVLELWLSEEEVELSTRIVPKQRVRVFVDTTTELIDVDASVAREVVEVDDHGRPA